MRRLVAVISMMWVVSGCAAPPPLDVASTPVPATTRPTSTLTPSATDTPTLTPSPTATATSTPTLTPTPISPVIHAENLDLLVPVAILTEANRPLHGVAVTGDGTRVASASADTRVRLYDGVTGELLHVLRRHNDMAYSVAFSPDGLRLVSGGRDRTVQIWDVLTGERIIGARTSGEVLQVSYAADGSRFAGAGPYSATGEVWAPDGGDLGLLGGHTTRLRSIAYDLRGEWLATGDADGVVILRDAATGEPVHTLQTTGEVYTLAFSPMGDLLAVGTRSSDLSLWDLTTFEVLGTWRAHAGGVLAAGFTPDGRILVSGGGDGALRFWDTTTLDRLESTTWHSGPLNELAVARDGSVIVTGGEDSTLLLWRVPE